MKPCFVCYGTGKVFGGMCLSCFGEGTTTSRKKTTWQKLKSNAVGVAPTLRRLVALWRRLLNRRRSRHAERNLHRFGYNPTIE
jgi:hypothetical protein